MEIFDSIVRRAILDYGQNSVLAYECNRLMLNYAVATLGGKSRVDDVVLRIKVLSKYFCGNDAIQVLQPDIFREKDFPILLPASRNCRDLYSRQYFEIRDTLIGGYPPDGHPLNQFPYVIHPNRSFVSSRIPTSTRDTIIGRSPRLGKIVHPSLAYNSAFEVVCAGEISVIKNCNINSKIIILNTCSGHYVPRHISATDLYDLLRHSPALVDDQIIIFFTTSGSAVNLAAAKLLGIAT